MNPKTRSVGSLIQLLFSRWAVLALKSNTLMKKTSHVMNAINLVGSALGQPLLTVTHVQKGTSTTKAHAILNAKAIQSQALMVNVLRNVTPIML